MLTLTHYCKDPGCNIAPIAGGYCRDHQWKRPGTELIERLGEKSGPKPKPEKTIPGFSESADLLPEADPEPNAITLVMALIAREHKGSWCHCSACMAVRRRVKKERISA